MSDDEGLTHVVSQGETLLSIAHDYGFRMWETIWEHPRNAEFRKLRPDPNVLYPGDEVFVPPKKLKQEAAKTGVRNHYWVKNASARLRYVVRFENGRKAANLLYRLRVGDKLFEGRTDADGAIEHEIPTKAREGQLTVWFDESNSEARLSWTLDIGGLDPIDTIAGVQKRLNNLGFDAGPATGAMNSQTIEALREFQEFIGHENPTGELDDETRRALEYLNNAA